MSTAAGFSEQPKRCSHWGVTTGLPHTPPLPTTATAQPTTASVDTTKTQEWP